jgi:hypothetical protein
LRPWPLLFSLPPSAPTGFWAEERRSEWNSLTQLRHVNCGLSHWRSATACNNQKSILLNRLIRKAPSTVDPNEKFKISEVLAAIKSPHVIILTITQFMSGTAAYSVTYFTPTSESFSHIFNLRSSDKSLANFMFRKMLISFSTNIQLFILWVVWNDFLPKSEDLNNYVHPSSAIPPLTLNLWPLHPLLWHLLVSNYLYTN